jgi:Tfp pilus assembly PilM family ATPase
LDTFTKRLMTLTLNLPLELERYIVQEAKQQGISIESVTLQLLTSSMLLKLKQAEAVSLIQSWIDDEDIEEQQETGQYLIRALDEDRLSERKLFPVEMKGVTW